MEKVLTELFEHLTSLATWLDNECPAVMPPLEPYDNSDLSHDFTSQLRKRIDKIKEMNQAMKERKATIANIKVYKCTDCGARTYLKDNGEITVGFCKKCGHPLWNPAEQPVLMPIKRKYKEL